MKVLILHQHFKTPQSGGAIRSWYLAKALVEKGIEAVVITAHNEKRYLQKNVDGIEVHYLPVAYDNKFGFFERGFSFLLFNRESVKLASTLKGVTIIYAISVPLTIGIAAMRIEKRLRVPYIFEVGDLWPDAPVQLGFIKNIFFRAYLFHLEKKIYRNARSIVALSPAIASAIESKMQGKRVDIIPNMADCDFYLPSKKDPHLEEQFESRDKFVVSYIGAAGYANGLDYFLECANVSRKQNLPIRFILCGDGAVKQRLNHLAQKLGLTNISFIDFQTRDGVCDVMNITDATFVCYRDVPILETGSPNKFFDGLAAGKLIVVNFGGWIRKEIEENQCGIYVDPRQPTDFANKIRVFLDDDNRLSRFQMAARKLAEEKYSRKVLSEKFISIVF